MMVLKHYFEVVKHYFGRAHGDNNQYIFTGDTTGAIWVYRIQLIMLRRVLPSEDLTYVGQENCVVLISMLVQKLQVKDQE